jgi:DNA-binding response OmpR family regulator
LEVGADDYVAKPFSLRVLVARIKALLRAKEQIDDATTRRIMKSLAKTAWDLFQFA